MALVNTPIPGTAQIGQLLNLAKQAHQNALAKIGQKRSDLLRQYGYQADFNDEGAVKNLRVDAGNPFGIYQQLRRTHAVQADQARDSAIGRGISGGLRRQFEGDLRYNFGREDSEMGQMFTRGINDQVEAQREATTEYNRRLYEIELEKARQAILEQMFNMLAGGGGGGPGGVRANFNPQPSGWGDSMIVGPGPWNNEGDFRNAVAATIGRGPWAQDDNKYRRKSGHII